jgi:hypothetical protein
MSQFRFFQRDDRIYESPGLWKCYGSNDGITWIEIKDASNTVTTTSYSSFANTITLQKVTPFYLYIGWVIGTLFTTGGNGLRFIEVQVFGTSIMKTIGTNTYSQNQKVFNCDTTNNEVRCAMSKTTPSIPACLYDRMATTAAVDAGYPSPDSSSASTVPTSTIVAASVGTTLGVVVLIAIVTFLIFKRRRQQRRRQNVLLTA